MPNWIRLFTIMDYKFIRFCVFIGVIFILIAEIGIYLTSQTYDDECLTSNFAVVCDVYNAFVGLWFLFPFLKKIDISFSRMLSIAAITGFFPYAVLGISYINESICSDVNGYINFSIIIYIFLAIIALIFGIFEKYCKEVYPNEIFKINEQIRYKYDAI